MINTNILIILLSTFNLLFYFYFTRETKMLWVFYCLSKRSGFPCLKIFVNRVDPCSLTQGIMFLFLSSFSTIFFIPKGKLAWTSLQHLANSWTLVTSSLDSLFKTSSKLFVLHWYSFCRRRRKTSTEAETTWSKGKWRSRPLSQLR